MKKRNTTPDLKKEKEINNYEGSPGRNRKQNRSGAD